MARPLRIQAPDIIYHVTARGNARRAVFIDDEDRLRFLDLLARTCEVHAILCLAYCLMENHYHWLCRTTDANLSAAVRDLNGGYAQWWNRRHGTVGHVWQGRYFAQLVQENNYFRTAVAYILRNPVRAGLCATAADWRWSSYSASAGTSSPPPFLACKELWTLLGNHTRDAGQACVSALVGASSGEDSDDWPQKGESWLAGSGAFADRIRVSGAIVDHPEATQRDRFAGRPVMGDLFDGVKSRQDRDVRIRAARLQWHYSLSAIGRHLGMHYSTVSKIVGVRS